MREREWKMISLAIVQSSMLARPPRNQLPLTCGSIFSPTRILFFSLFFYSLCHHVSWRFCRTAVDALRSLHCLKSEIHKMFLNLSRKRYLDPWTLLNVWFRSKLPVRLLMWQPNMLISYWYKSNPEEEKETDQPLWLLAQCKSKKEKNILIKFFWFLTYHHRNLLACMPHFLEFQESIAFASGTRFRRYLKVSVWF